MPRIDYIANTVSRTTPSVTLEEIQRMVAERLAVNLAENYGFPPEFIAQSKPLTVTEVAMRRAEAAARPPICLGICQPHRKHVDSRIVEPKQLSSG